MEYCSMSSSFYNQRGTKEKISVEESLKRHAALGIKNIDLNMCAVGRFGEHQFDREDWYKQACEIRELAEKLGLKFVQSHLPYRSVLSKWNFFDPESYSHMAEYTLRAMKISNIVGAQWAVVHPAWDENYSSDRTDKHIEENHKFYAACLEEAEKGCCGLAFENMNDTLVRPLNRRYCVQVEQLIELVDSFKSDKVQINWDFGHANLCYGDQQDWAIRQIGSRLKSVHVADNFGQVDDHFAPYQGKIDWSKIYKALADIDYQGYWDFEIGPTYSNLPDGLRESAMKFYKDIAEYMIAEFEKVKATR